MLHHLEKSTNYHLFSVAQILLWLIDQYFAAFTQHQCIPRKDFLEESMLSKDSQSNELHSKYIGQQFGGCRKLSEIVVEIRMIVSFTMLDM